MSDDIGFDDSYCQYTNEDNIDDITLWNSVLPRYCDDERRLYDHRVKKFRISMDEYHDGLDGIICWKLIYPEVENIPLCPDIGLNDYLFRAIEAGALDEIKEHVNSSNINCEDRHGNSLLSYSIQFNQYEIVKFLLEHKAIPDPIGEYCLVSPLIKAIEVGNHKITELLLSFRANPNITVKNSPLPLNLAIIKNDVNTIASLLEFGANPTLQEYMTGNTSLHYVANVGALDVVAELIKRGATINVVNNFNETPLHIASRHGYFDLVRYFVLNGTDINAVNSLNQTPLHLACKTNSIDVIGFLILHNAKVNTEDYYKTTPLHEAVSIGNVNIIKMLLYNNASINAQNNYGSTPLHIAAIHNHREVIDLLIRCGACPYIKDAEGKTPGDYI